MMKMMSSFNRQLISNRTNVLSYLQHARAVLLFQHTFFPFPFGKYYERIYFSLTCTDSLLGCFRSQSLMLQGMTILFTYTVLHLSAGNYRCPS